MTSKEATPRREERTAQLTRWVTLGRACALVGVNESTLRRWADAGMVRSFRTPGGHRRFAEEDLRAMTAGRVYEPATSAYESLADLALGRLRRRLGRGRGYEARWYQEMSEGDRERVVSLARRLVTLVGEYLSKRGGRQRLLEEARGLGREFGRELAQARLRLGSGIEAFAFLRRNLDDTAIELVRRGSLATEDLTDVWEALASVADQVLVAIPDAYEEVRPSVAAGATS